MRCRASCCVPAASTRAPDRESAGSSANGRHQCSAWERARIRAGGFVANEMDIRQLLEAWRDGDRGAVQRLIPLVYDELRAIARGRGIRAHPDDTLQTTAIVHEAFL